MNFTAFLSSAQKDYDRVLSLLLVAFFPAVNMMLLTLYNSFV